MGHDLTSISYSPRPRDALYNHVRLSYSSGSKLLRKFDPAFSFGRINTATFDVLHYHGDDYLVRGDGRRVRTFYGSALSEALHARKVSRFMYQGLFYFFEWMSCLRKGSKAGISKATTNALPLVKTVIPCGVPLDRFKPDTPKTDYPSILFLGDLTSRKRGKYLLELFNNDIIKKYPECTLTVVGPEPCEGINVRYVGNLGETNLIAEYQKAWVYCMPSSYEGFGVPIIEAMACGAAVVAVDNPSVRETIQHNYNGFLLDDSTLSQGIDHILSNSNLRKRLEENGIYTVQKKFDIKTIAAEYEKLYRSLCKH